MFWETNICCVDCKLMFIAAYLQTIKFMLTNESLKYNNSYKAKKKGIINLNSLVCYKK